MGFPEFDGKRYAGPIKGGERCFQGAAATAIG
jgi:hypothetical protein